MLSRAVLRTVNPAQLRPTPAAFRAATVSRSTRAYAKDNHPRQAPKKPTDYSKTPVVGKSPPSATDAHRTAGAGAAFGASESASTAKSSDNSGNPDFSSKQDEFQTAADPAQNTAPQTSSPSAIDPALNAAPNRPLPDLTQGIPSTLDYETMGGNSAKETDDTALNLTEAGGRGRGELPSSAYVSSLERKRLRIANYLYAAFALFATTGTVYLGRNWETEEEEARHPAAPSGWSPALFWGRAKARLTGQLDYYNEPAFPKLLPDVDPSWERPYTLVLSLEDLLIHSEWTRENGWRLAKRPGVDYFLRYLSQYYELVIFTSVPSTFADPVIRKLDPFRIIMWPLFREATRYKDGKYIKVSKLVSPPRTTTLMKQTGSLIPEP